MNNIKQLRVSEETKEQLETIKQDYGLVSDAAAFRLAVALVSKGGVKDGR